MSFGWDQERDAQVVWQIIKEGKFTLIGPRAVGPNSFFLGPLWFYLLLPFYFIFSMNPLGIGVFGIIVQLVTTLVFFLVGKKLFGEKVGIISAFLYLPTGAMVVWNPMLIPLLSLILIYLFSQIISGKEKFIPITLFTLGLGLQVHFQAIFLFIPFIISLYFFKKNPLPAKQALIGTTLFLITFLPLIIFDIRHNFLNTQGLFKLFFRSAETSTDFFQHFLEGIFKFLSSISNPFYNLSSQLLINGFISLLVAIFILKDVKKEIKYILFSFLLIPPFLFSFYSRDLSEYYFTLTAAPLLFSFSILLTKLYNLRWGKIIFYSVIFLVLLNKFSIFNSSFIGTNLFYQKQAVLYIVNQKTDPIFNVSFDTPFNGDAGFRYLFKYYGRQPQDIPEGHLWTIAIPPEAAGVEPDATFGDIGIIRR